MGSHVYKYTPASATNREVSSELPQSIWLDQNYPTPFNPRTTIEFDLRRASYVQLHIYTLLGERVARLIDEPLAPGRHRTHWDASGLASGVYLYRLQADGQFTTRKHTPVQ